MSKPSKAIYSKVLDEFNNSSFLQIQEKHRHSLMKKIQKLREGVSGRKTKVILYYAKLDSPAQREVMVNQWDIKAIYSILNVLADDINIELVVNTLGGMPQKTRQIINLIRHKLDGKGNLRIVVPEIAKSAGTLICLGGDNLTLGTTSELGLVDPQIPRYSPSGKVEYISAWTYIKSLDYLLKKATNSKGNLKQEFYPLLANFDMPFYEKCNQAIEQIKADTKNLLKEGMLKKQASKKINKTARYFLGDGKPHETLLQPSEISKSLGKKVVEILDEEDSLWSLYWELHCRATQLMEKTPIVKFIEVDSTMLNRQVTITPR